MNIPTICRYCGGKVELTDAREIYGDAVERRTGALNRSIRARSGSSASKAMRIGFCLKTCV
jgi:hypothetical protein